MNIFIPNWEYWILRFLVWNIKLKIRFLQKHLALPSILSIWDKNVASGYCILGSVSNCSCPAPSFKSTKICYDRIANFSWKFSVVHGDKIILKPRWEACYKKLECVIIGPKFFWEEKGYPHLPLWVPIRNSERTMRFIWS